MFGVRSHSFTASLYIFKSSAHYKLELIFLDSWSTMILIAPGMWAVVSQTWCCMQISITVLFNFSEWQVPIWLMQETAVVLSINNLTCLQETLSTNDCKPSWNDLSHICGKLLELLVSDDFINLDIPESTILSLHIMQQNSLYFAD